MGIKDKAYALSFILGVGVVIMLVAPLQLPFG